MKEIDVEKLYDLAGKDALQLERELYRFSYALNSDLDLKYFFVDNGVSEKNKRTVLADLFPAASRVFRDLFNLLLREELLERLSWLANKYSEVVSKKTATEYLEVTSAVPLLNENVFKAIKPDKIRYRFKVDPKIIGGLKLKWEDGRYYDSTLQGEIEAIKEALIV
ncbi:MAG: F0F1 ATP synthase subunit delta [bacterium]